jgi:hypothetical protein
MCSMAISFINCMDREATTTLRPLWMKILKERCGVHEAWMENLKQPCVAQFEKNMQLSVIVDVVSCQWLNLVPAMLDSHISIWYYWGSINPELSQPGRHTLACANRVSIDECCPTTSEITSASAPHEPPPPSPLPNDPTLNFKEAPKPEPGSRQHQGETWQQFFARQEVRHAEKRSVSLMQSDREERAAKTLRQVRDPLGGKVL